LAVSVPLSRFTSPVGGGSAFFVRRLIAVVIISIPQNQIMPKNKPSDDAPEIDVPLLKLQIENEKLRRQVTKLTAEKEALKAQIDALNKTVESQDARILGFLKAQDKDGTLTKRMIPPDSYN
jgi:predicted  nucleic acid-binding Zn-ribbon protein